MGDFRKAWRSLCISVGLGRMVCRACGKTAKEGKCNECRSRDLKYDGLLVHDLRRTGVRNLRRLGFAERTIMEISGHQTPWLGSRFLRNSLALTFHYSNSRRPSFPPHNNDPFSLDS